MQIKNDFVFLEIIVFERKKNYESKQKLQKEPGKLIMVILLSQLVRK